MIPHYLYHYTSVESLIKILNSKKIRFKRLDLLNDPYEGYIEIEEILLAPQVDAGDVVRINKYLSDNNISIPVVPSCIKTRFDEE